MSFLRFERWPQPSYLQMCVPCSSTVLPPVDLARDAEDAGVEPAAAAAVVVVVRLLLVLLVPVLFL